MGKFHVAWDSTGSLLHIYCICEHLSSCTKNQSQTLNAFTAFYVHRKIIRMTVKKLKLD